MRSSLIRLTVALLVLAACDKKKSAPTETGMRIDVRSLPGAPAVLNAPTGLTHAG